ncbi:GntR family transcriptional regulator [Nocardioides sp. NPDC087217]|uniref:GntR family transcriptional regulator n=1 Tax=Nocardioides sp. NPDC087217 TaxID=3364335 RepID=UPI0037F9D73C
MTGSANDAVIDSRPIADRVHAIIRKRILSGQLAGGAPVKDSVLATELGVSRAPVRQALDRLALSGLVIKLPNKPCRVVSIDRESLSELQLLRFADESAAIHFLVANQSDLSPLRDRLKAIERAAESGRWSQIAQADLAFHREVVALTGLPRLIARFDDILDQVHTWLTHADPPELVVSTQLQRHIELTELLLEAQRTHDGRPAIIAWEAHILGDRREQLASLRATTT